MIHHSPVTPERRDRTKKKPTRGDSSRPEKNETSTWGKECPCVYRLSQVETIVKKKFTTGVDCVILGSTKEDCMIKFVMHVSELYAAINEIQRMGLDYDIEDSDIDGYCHLLVEKTETTQKILQIGAMNELWEKSS